MQASATKKTEIDRYRRYYRAMEEIVKRPKANAYTTAIFSFLAVSLFGWYAVRPTLQTILTLRREIADNTKISARMEDKITKLIEVQAGYQSVQDDIPLLDQALPNTPDAIGVVNQIKILAQANNASVSGISVSSVPIIGKPSESTVSGSTQDATNKKVLDVPISTIITGSYPALRSFIEGLITLRRIVTIDTITLNIDTDTKVSSTSSDIALKMTVKVNAHYTNSE